MLDVERAPADWAGIRPPTGARAGAVLFVDGVRRVEARVWIQVGSEVHAGVCATYAAGVVRCDGAAVVGPTIVGRALFTPYGEAEDILTMAGPFPARIAAGGSPEALALAIQERMGKAEVAAAEEANRQDDADLIVVDGPLRGRQHLPRTVGYVKTHHVQYLPSELHAQVGGLHPGERSPVFCLGTTWSRFTWYLRLPSSSRSPWSGIVRCECSSDISVQEATTLADAVAATVPRFASQPHKDPRAPQNLYPIGGLERELRRRMGDPLLVLRALMIAAT